MGNGALYMEEEEKIKHEVNFALERVEAYIDGLLGSLEKYKFEGDENAIKYIKGILNHVKSIKVID